MNFIKYWCDNIQTVEWIRFHQPAIILAPMEGIADYNVRRWMTSTGAFDYSVTEFFRVTQHPIPPSVFKKRAPEILDPINNRTWVQILGGDPHMMAESALNAVSAGATAIDINFGCPAPTVNRHDGGATLLKYPSRLESIVRAIRDRLPSHISVSAKLRLGWDTIDAIDENAKRTEQGGANWISIHGRTRMAGYQPPAFWKPIGRVKKALSIPVVANGEIWSVEDFTRCREETECEHFMLGRGAMASPATALAIRTLLNLKRLDHQSEPPQSIHANEWATWLSQLSEKMNVQLVPDDAQAKRLKGIARFVAMKSQPIWWEDFKRSSQPLNYLKMEMGKLAFTEPN